jgi:hypothetical protein
VIVAELANAPEPVGSPRGRAPPSPVLLALIAAALLAGTRATRAETCVATASGTWGPLAGGSVGWNCGGGAPEASDHFFVPAGVTVTLVGDVLQDPLSTGGVTVAAGGTLRASVSPATGAITLALGSLGLACSGTCELAGGYRTASLSPPSIVSALDAPGTSWRVGDVVPCGGDCTARSHVVRFAWDASPKLEHSLARIAPGEDVACFWDPAPDDASASAEVNQCWAVVGTGASAGEVWLELDVRQGSRDQAGFPLARRAIHQVTHALPVQPGDRHVVVDSTLLAGPLENGRFVGRWLRFAGEGGRALDTPLKILASEDGGAAGDTIVLGDPRGAPEAHAALEPAWIDHGFASGDPFFVMAPVRIASATVQPGDSPVQILGALDARSVFFDGVRQVVCSGCAFQLREYWLADPTAGHGSALELTNTLDAIVERGCQSGGDSRAAFDRTHAFHVPSNANLRVSDLSIRHHGDDAVGMGSAETSATFDRIHVASRSDHADSCNCVSISGGHPHRVAMRDVVCEDATDDDWNFQIAIGAGGAATLEGALVWAGRGTLTGNSSPQLLEVRDLTLLGVDSQVQSPLLPESVEGFVIRDSIQRQVAGTGDACLSNPGTPFSVRDGILRDVRIAGPTYCLLSEGVLENVAFVNARGDDDFCSVGPSGCDAIRIGDPHALRIRNVSLVWQDGVITSLSHGLHVPAPLPLPGDLVLDGLLVHGFRGIGDDQALATVDAATIFDPSTPVAGPCLSANDHDGNGDFLSNAPPSTWTGVDPGFRDLAAGRVDTLPGSAADTAGCGVRRGVASPGVKRFRWVQAISKLAPERLADDADGDGVPEDPEAPPCAAGQREDCNDSCPSAFDPGQADADGDGRGDACDAACDNGSDDDGDGLADFPADPGCDAPEDASERAAHLPCDDGEDDDSDLVADAMDPGCAGPGGPREDPACDDGVDNDGDGRLDADDPACSAANWPDSEQRRRCGAGAEAAPIVVLLAAARRHRRAARRGVPPGAPGELPRARGGPP